MARIYLSHESEAFLSSSRYILSYGDVKGEAEAKLQPVMQRLGNENLMNSGAAKFVQVMRDNAARHVEMGGRIELHAVRRLAQELRVRGSTKAVEGAFRSKRVAYGEVLLILSGLDSKRRASDSGTVVAKGKQGNKRRGSFVEGGKGDDDNVEFAWHVTKVLRNANSREPDELALEFRKLFDKTRDVDSAAEELLSRLSTVGETSRLGGISDEAVLNALKAAEIVLRSGNLSHWRSIALCMVSERSRALRRFHEAKGYALAALKEALQLRSSHLAALAERELRAVGSDQMKLGS